MSLNIIPWVKFYNILLILPGALLPSILIVNGFGNFWNYRETLSHKFQEGGYVR